MDDLQSEINSLRNQIETLSRDDAYGMWTRAAFLQFCRVMPRGRRTVVFIDFDDIHSLNQEVGYVEVDRRIREAFSIPFRKSDLVARWYSGDEIVILFDSEAPGVRKKMAELRASAARQGLAFSWTIGAWEVGRVDVTEVVNVLSERNRRKRRPAREAQREQGKR